MHDAVARWATDALRSTNAHVEYLLRRARAQAGRLPKDAGPLPRRGRPPTTPEPPSDADASAPTEEDDPT